MTGKKTGYDKKPSPVVGEGSNTKKQRVLRKGQKYAKIAEGLVSDDWGYTCKLEIKDRRPTGLEPCINFISSGGRWFFFIPVGLWEETKKQVDEMMRSCNL